MWNVISRKTGGDSAPLHLSLHPFIRFVSLVIRHEGFCDSAALLSTCLLWSNLNLDIGHSRPADIDVFP